ncbi:hypothetical protein FEM48_ZijujUnG0037000 [Ziziphus jujuba var. spinosa]|uniref:Pentatricopeptide repeat-containing protein At5g67570, chloroplastic n=1 Tax=Ziziphus jujuba var. spinosa TaxID=714518 RepID=A0A978U9I3_ZIZJJ|nr:hypothetical protein FEM48_ZijujUnG0037000 [Ziziphus jujuba var. spinosa]
MEALQGAPQIPPPQFEPDIEKIKRKLINKSVNPTPKIIHTLRKKEIQKHNRKLKRLADRAPYPPLTEPQEQALDEEFHFQRLKREYKDFSKAVKAKTGAAAGNGDGASMVGMPWQKLERVGFRELASASNEYKGEKLKREELRDLKEMFESRKREELQLVLDDDIEIKEEWFDGEQRAWDPLKRRRSEVETIRFLLDRLSGLELSRRDWKLSRMMKKSGLQFTEKQMLKIVEGLGAKGCWQQAMSVVDWVYDDRDKRQNKSRFVYTKLLAILGKARRPREALDIFNLMRRDCSIYPDMAAYRSIAVTLGQAGHLKELVNIIECMKQKPSKRTKNIIRYKNWNPVLEPDLVVYNAVLNACVPSHQWKGVSWVFDQLRKSGLKPNAASYGLAMEVMLQSGKFDLVHEFFRKMKKSGEAPTALTYRVLVRAFWGEGKVNEAVEAVRDMEQRGVVGTSSVYYELACCLCCFGRWQDAMVEVGKMKKLSNSKPLEVTFTGMIAASMDGGHIDDCISIFEHMKNHCAPNIGTINTMLNIYGRNDMFSKAKKLFEEIKKVNPDSSHPSLDGEHNYLIPDEYTYSSMLKASASALQWDYFECVYKEMTLSGYQLDQSKHALLLPEASRAGKWHLLEHAFDTTLEAGEIPHPSWFTEMVFQVIAREDYERAITLINTMAYSPFQVSEKQWKELLEKNRDRISKDHQEKLLAAMDNCDVASEATVFYLKRSLRFLCGSGSSRDLSSSIGCGSGHMDDASLLDGNDEGFDFGRQDVLLQDSEQFIDGDPDCSENPVMDCGDVPSCTSRDITGVEMVSGSSNNDNDDDGETNSHTGEIGFGKDMAYGEFSDPLDDKFSAFDPTEESKDDNVIIESLINGVDHSYESDLPSAYEVLEAWKESRRKDGIVFPFQLGHR